MIRWTIEVRGGATATAVRRVARRARERGSIQFESGGSSHSKPTPLTVGVAQVVKDDRDVRSAGEFDAAVPLEAGWVPSKTAERRSGQR
jgi:hypothetical protein